VSVGSGVAEGIGVRVAVGGSGVFSSVGEGSVTSSVTGGAFVGRLHEERKSIITSIIDKLRRFMGSSFRFHSSQ
ncbi:MAG: hypothetical protein ACT6FF_08595, partial [Methanosarcinaceae archaeon]